MKSKAEIEQKKPKTRMQKLKRLTRIMGTTLAIGAPSLLAIWPAIEIGYNKHGANINIAYQNNFSLTNRDDREKAIKEKVVETLNKNHVPREHVKGLDLLITNFFMGSKNQTADGGKYYYTTHQTTVDSVAWERILLHELAHKMFRQIYGDMTPEKRLAFRKNVSGWYFGYLYEKKENRNLADPKKVEELYGFGPIEEKELEKLLEGNPDWDEIGADLMAKYFQPLGGAEWMSLHRQRGIDRFKAHFKGVFPELPENPNIETSDIKLILPEWHNYRRLWLFNLKRMYANAMELPSWIGKKLGIIEE